MSRADSKHKPSRQIFKGIHCQEKKAAEIRNFLPNFAVPEHLGREGERGAGGRAIPAGAAGATPASHSSSFTPCGTARPQPLLLGVGGSFRCALDELGWAARTRTSFCSGRCACSGTSHSLAEKTGEIRASGGCERLHQMQPALLSRTGLLQRSFTGWSEIWSPRYPRATSWG